MPISGRPASNFWLQFILYAGICRAVASLNNLAKSFGKARHDPQSPNGSGPAQQPQPRSGGRTGKDNHQKRRLEPERNGGSNKCTQPGINNH